MMRPSNAFCAEDVKLHKPSAIDITTTLVNNRVLYLIDGVAQFLV